MIGADREPVKPRPGDDPNAVRVRITMQEAACRNPGWRLERGQATSSTQLAAHDQLAQFREDAGLCRSISKLDVVEALTGLRLMSSHGDIGARATRYTKSLPITS